MTPKEKAEELINKFKQYSYDIGKDTSFAKQCALITADETINVAYWTSVRQYWEEVKQEIQQL